MTDTLPEVEERWKQKLLAVAAQRDRLAEHREMLIEERDQLQRDNAALREGLARRDDQREHMLNSIVEDGRLFLDLKAWLLQCHDWLLSSDLDMQCPMQTDPLDLVDRIERSFGVPRVLLNPSNTGGG